MNNFDFQLEKIQSPTQLNEMSFFDDLGILWDMMEALVVLYVAAKLTGYLREIIDNFKGNKSVADAIAIADKLVQKEEIKARVRRLHTMDIDNLSPQDKKDIEELEREVRKLLSPPEKKKMRKLKNIIGNACKAVKDSNEKKKLAKISKKQTNVQDIIKKIKKDN